MYNTIKMIKHKWGIMNKLGKMGKNIKCNYVVHKGGTILEKLSTSFF